ncbi:phosphodiester glycosidase family protein [Clostridium sp. ZS2-4]|uniref:phosphodiester glycosidase family protein n=1 Tax=Clostridium sp. ZS2-4 TaxID=2987703 RepID=UPI00227CEA43|nr:phosphodiester glycosidase family protein [Clostridium sp. ZS2-4]MCY6354326.1 phosphodiester glycosidase family protein [Clostridium sp. ZS2-4]
MKKKKLKSKIFKFFLLELIFCSITTPFTAFYGPFNNVRDTLVGMSMTTMSHRWIAKLFLSDKEIQNILSENSVETVSQSKKDIDNMTIKSDNKNNIERYVLEDTGFKGYLLVISNPKKVKVGYAEKLGEVGQTTSEIAKRFNAVAAVNGGAFKDKTANGTLYAGTGAFPLGILMSNGKVIRSTVKKNEETEIIGITKKGILLVGKYSLEQLEDLNCSEALSYGPPLIVNGEKVKIKGNGGWGSAPRTAIGQRKDGSILLLVIDGTVVKRFGVSMSELQDILYDQGAYTAANLDGGSSTTMYFQGKVINNPCDSIGERCIPSAIYVEP